MDLDAFARVVALLSDPFVDRRAVLAEAGLANEDAWEAELAAWTVKLGAGGSLQERFAASYARARLARVDRPRTRGLSAEAATVALSADPGPVPPLQKPADAPSLPHRIVEPDYLDTTGEVVQRVAPVLPFADPAGLSPAVAEAAARIIVRKDTGTVEVPHISPRRVTPFEAPPPKVGSDSGALHPSTRAPPSVAPAGSAAEPPDDDLDRTIEYQRQHEKPPGAR
jgi:hypothetical protein